MNIYVDQNIYRYPGKNARLKFDVDFRDSIKIPLINRIFKQNCIYDVRFGINDEDECICVSRDGDFIVVYFSERGGRNFIAAFTDISDAAEYLFCKYSNGKPFPIDWLHVAAQIDLGITDPDLIIFQKNIE
jgi:hypothetical protein